MVHHPGVVKSRAWKFARPFYGPYEVLALTSTNAEVRLVDHPSDPSIFVSLDRLRPCYAEMSNDVWVGHRRPRTAARPESSVLPPLVGGPSPEYTGPVTRSRTRSPN